MLKLFNSLGRKKEKFKPIVPGQVSIYVCGMTVYDLCHIGHARVLVFFDVVRRWFESNGFKVKYVRNITDIDDKIIARALKEGITVKELTTKYIKEMQKDASDLDVRPPSHEPLATDYIDEMIQLINTLVEKGNAYLAQGDVNFSVRSHKSYGKLSGKSINQLQAGSRVDIDHSKKDPLDFVLWKKSKIDEPKEVSWNSPFGNGRPGWHIECSAMSHSIFGNSFDIHGGGIDLQFPHHENEIAQSESGYGNNKTPFKVNFWMHVGFVTILNEKMSKSLGNFETIKDILANYNYEVLRFFLIKGHYRSPLNYSKDQLNDAKNSLRRLYELLSSFDESEIVSRKEEKKLIDEMMSCNDNIVINFRDALSDDFNTPKALSIIFEFANNLKQKSKEFSDPLAFKSSVRILRGMGLILGILGNSLSSLDKKINNQISNEFIEDLIKKRNQAKINRQYDLADEIRDNLRAKGIILEDKPDGTQWRAV